ncbi:hypothetical protein B7463_g2809, partial [Scytalidium lignicola]
MAGPQNDGDKPIETGQYKPGSTNDPTSGHHQSETKGGNIGVRAHEGNLGPAIPDNMNIQQEGTKEERRAKAQALNK